MLTLGIDVGGTKMKLGLIDANNNEIADASYPTAFTDFSKDLANCALRFLQEKQISIDEIDAIGVGVPGTVDRRGNILLAPNIRVKNLALRKELNQELCKPVAVLNDADAATLAEATLGKGKGCDSVVLCTLGTGVGMGIVINGSLWRGFNGCAGEVGHATLLFDGKKCNCGSKGCLEKYCSATALVAQAQQAGVNVNNTKVLFDLLKTSKQAAAVINKYIDYLAAGLSSVINILAPETLLLGGGLSEAGDALLIPLRKKVNAQCMASHSGAELTKIEKAILGNKAGFLGAALYVKQRKDAV